MLHKNALKRKSCPYSTELSIAYFSLAVRMVRIVAFSHFLFLGKVFVALRGFSRFRSCVVLFFSNGQLPMTPFIYILLYYTGCFLFVFFPYFHLSLWFIWVTLCCRCVLRHIATLGMRWAAVLVQWVWSFYLTQNKWN